MPMHTHRFVYLDGLRGVAAVSVLVMHLSGGMDLPDFVPHGPLAVDFFFQLSGFVIAFAYDERLRDGRMGVRGFAAARLIRLYPMILLALLFGAAVYFLRIIALDEWGLITPLVESILLGALMLPSRLLTGPGYADAYPLNSPAWSLFFELAANAVYALFARWLSNAAVACLMVVGGIGLLAASLGHGGTNFGWDWGTFPLGAWRVMFGFFAGILMYRLRARFPSIPVLAALPLAAALVLVFTAPLPESWTYDAVSIFMVFPMMIVLGSGLLPAGGMAALCLFAGRLSYPLYILHYPAVRLAGGISRQHHLHEAALQLFFVIILFCILGISTLIMVMIDEPLRGRLSRLYSRRQKRRSTVLYLSG